MGNRRHPHAACKRCGKSRDEEGTLSARGLCLACGEKARYANIEQLVSHSGPYFDHWRGRCLASFGVMVVDDALSER